MGLSDGVFLVPESLSPLEPALIDPQAGSLIESGVLASTFGSSHLSPFAGWLRSSYWLAGISEKLLRFLGLSVLIWEDAASCFLGSWGEFCELKYGCLEAYLVSSRCCLAVVSRYKSHISLSLLSIFIFKLNWKEPNNARLDFSPFGETSSLPTVLLPPSPNLCRNPGK